MEGGAGPGGASPPVASATSAPGRTALISQVQFGGVRRNGIQRQDPRLNANRSLDFFFEGELVSVKLPRINLQFAIRTIGPPTDSAAAHRWAQNNNDAINDVPSSSASLPAICNPLKISLA